MQIEGQLTLITGASRGIGAATAHAMAAAGAKVILAARTQADLDRHVATISKAGGTAFAYAVDLAKLSSLQAFVAQVRQDHGTPDILINSAGIGRWLFLEDTPAEEAEMMIRLPYMAAFHLCREFLPFMLDRKSGHIVNINSPVSTLVWGSAAGYAGARWALRGMSEALKVDLRGTGVGVSHCVFGEVSSSYFEANPGAHEKLPKIAKLIPVSTPEQVAKWIMRAIRREKKEMTQPFMLGVFRSLTWLCPPLVKSIVRSSGHQRS